MIGANSISGPDLAKTVIDFMHSQYQEEIVQLGVTTLINFNDRNIFRNSFIILNPFKKRKL